MQPRIKNQVKAVTAPFGIVLDSRASTQRKCEAVPRRARIKGSQTFASLDSGLKSKKEEEAGDGTSRMEGLCGLAFKAHRPLYHLTIGASLIKKKKTADAFTGKRTRVRVVKPTVLTAEGRRAPWHGFARATKRGTAPRGWRVCREGACRGGRPPAPTLRANHSLKQSTTFTQTINVSFTQAINVSVIDIHSNNQRIRDLSSYLVVNDSA